MTGQTNNRPKIIATLLGVLLLGIFFYTLKLYQDKKEITAALEHEKELIITDLNHLKSEYDQAILEKHDLSEELVTARDNITRYIDSVQGMKADVAALSRYRRQISLLQTERERLIQQVDSLTQSNTLLAMQRDSTFVELEKQSTFNDSLLVQNTQLADALERGSALSLSAFSVDAVKERHSGKLISTSRASSTDKFKVCFTVAKNVMAEAGDKTFYIEVLDPQGNLLGHSFSQSNKEGASLTYSKATHFYYENTSLDVCDYLSHPSSQFREGNYMVNVYDSALKLLGTSKFRLR